MEEKLRVTIKEALSKVSSVSDVNFVVEWPANLDHGDYSTNVAMAAYGKLQDDSKETHNLAKRNQASVSTHSPRELAEEIATILREAFKEQFKSVEVAGPGFINFTLAHPVISGMVFEIPKMGSDWGKGASLEGKRYSIEYSCPNPFKEMHIGHLMTTIIGEALSRITENAGAHVIRDSYGGDVGPHVAKALWGLRDSGITEPATAKEVGAAYAHGARAYEESESAKAEIDAINRSVYEATDPELMELWRKGKDVSVEAFQELYKILGTHFDYFFYESETAAPGMEVVRDGVGKGIFKESEGAIIYEGEKKGLHTLVFVTSKGNPTYEAKELGLAFVKEQRIASDACYILTANEQIGHFNVVNAALEDIAPLIAAKTHHIPHGFLRLTTGKMASRTGNVVTASGFIAEILEKAQEKNEDPLIAQQVAIGAIKYMILRQAPGGDIIFDAEQSLALDGDSGPYLQYALVRAQSLLAAAANTQSIATDKSQSTMIYHSTLGGAPTPTPPTDIDVRVAGGEMKPEAPYPLERLLIRFPEVAQSAVKENAPQKVTQYLTQLAGEWNSFYGQGKIIGSEEQEYKLGIAKAFVTTMENGLRLLGIPTPERM